MHGNKPNIYFNGFDAIIAPGDFCSDDLRKYVFQALRENLENNGSKTKWYDIVSRREAKRMIKKSISEGRKVLERLNSFRVPVYIVPGNLDWTWSEYCDWDFLKQDHYRKLVKGFSNVVDVHYRIVSVGDYQIIGYGVSSGPEPSIRGRVGKINSNKINGKKGWSMKRA